MIDGVLDSYWSHWWTRQSDDQITFYEEWSFELQGGKYWSTGSDLEWYWCDFMHAESMDEVPCQMYKATFSESPNMVFFMAFKSNEAVINSVDDAEGPPTMHFYDSADPTTSTMLIFKDGASEPEVNEMLPPNPEDGQLVPEMSKFTPTEIVITRSEVIRGEEDINYFFQEGWPFDERNGIYIKVGESEPMAMSRLE